MLSPSFLRSVTGTLPRRSGLLCAALLGVGCSSSLAQSSLSTYEFVGVSNIENSNSIDALSSNGTSDGSYSSTQFSQSFTGLDRNGNTQTTNYTGFANGSATYGQLHLDTGATVANTYYNASNPIYYDGNTGAVNPAGSPDNYVTGAFINFSDTLQYGGALQAGYQSRYIFRVDGSNNGYGAGEYLNVSIAGNNQESFGNSNAGNVADTYATMDYPINGTTPQTVNVTFAGYFELFTQNVADGSNITGEANFSDTATLAGIEIVDANGNPVSGVTITSDSGTVYQEVVPEPSTWAAVLAGAGLLTLVLRRSLSRLRQAHFDPSPFILK